MEEDDDFGDLYTDVLRPTSVQAAPSETQNTTAGNLVGGGGGGDDDDDDSQILHGSSRSAALAIDSSSRLPRPQAASLEDADDDWLLGQDPLPVEEPTNWVEDEEEVMVARAPAEDVVCFPAKGCGARVLDIKQTETAGVSFVEQVDALGSGGSVEKMAKTNVMQEDEPVIPGLSLVFDPSKTPNGGYANAAPSDDCESDSEDDLQIVLNDVRHDPQGADSREGRGSDDDDEDGEEDLVIVTDEDQHHRHHQAMEEQDWSEDALHPFAEGDKKDMLEGAKANGASAFTSGAGIGYNNHSFHPQHHSMFKYVRPGAIPTPGGSVNSAAGVASQVCSTGFGPMAGRGRGDWRPTSGRGFSNMQKGFHSGYGLPAWGNSVSARPFGVGLDFTLPSYKTVFDVDIESFEEKPWRHPGIDISDFFNFGLDEEHWKEYYKQVEQLRVESTMQGKIRVYESGRSQQDFDPYLPSELAAATGQQDMTVDNTRLGKSDNGQIDISGQGSACMRPPLPTGRAILVEGGYGERLPSVDTRPPRIRDSDSVIEIVLQDNPDESTISNGLLKQPENNILGENLKGFHYVDEDDRPAGSEYDHFPHSARGEPLSGQVDEISSFPSEPSRKYDHIPKTVSLEDSAHTFGGQHSERFSQGTSHGRNSITSLRSSETVPSQNVHLDKHERDLRERDGLGIEGNQAPDVSPNKVEITRELSLERREGEHEDRLSLGDSHDGDGEASDYHVSTETAGEDCFTHSPKRQKSSSYVEQSAVWDNGDGDDSRLAHSDDSRAKSGNSRGYQRRHQSGEEEMQAGRSKRVGDLRKHHEEEEYIWKNDYIRDSRREMDRNHATSRGRENMHQTYPCKDWDSGAGHTYQRSEVFDRKMDSSVSVCQRREDDNHIRRIKDGDIKRGRNEEIGPRERSKVRVSDRNGKIEDHQKMRVNGDRRASSRDKVLRHWERDDSLMSRRENLEDTQFRRKRDDELVRRVRVEKEDSLNYLRAREDSSRRKRGRDDIVDHRRRDDDVKTKTKAEEHRSIKHKDDNLHQREREDRHRLKLSHDDSLALREREEKPLASRTGRLVEEKSVSGSGMTKDPKVAGSDRDHHHKDRRRHNEQPKRANRTGEENEFQKRVRGETNTRGRRFNSEEGSMKHECSSGASDELHVQKERQRESGRKIKDPEHNVQNRETSGKRKHEDHSSHHIKLKHKGEQESIKHSSKEGKKDHWDYKEQMEALLLPAPSNGEKDPASDDENDESRRGRSKLERWASHKERDYNTIDDNILSSSSVIKHVEDSDAKNPEVTDMRASDAVQVADKAGDDRDRHLDTVAKLRMRSERFKLPMPGEKEKDLTGNKKAENETLPVIENEDASTPAACTDMDIKPERPARKRRWTGS